MKKFEFGWGKKSPLPGKKQTTPAATAETLKPHIIADDDGISDCTDSEHGGSTELDITDGRGVTSQPDPAKTKEAIEKYKRKIEKIKMEIQREQVVKEDHVKEYLDLSNKARNIDESKVKNIKLVFEKNNQVSAQKIASLQIKLEKYQTDVRRVEQHGTSTHRAAKDMLKDVGQGIKDFGGSVVGNIRTATTLVSKPRDHHNSSKSKSGSADNLHMMGTNSHNSQSLPPMSYQDNGKNDRNSDSPVSPTGSTTLPANFKLNPINGADYDTQGGEVNSTSEASFQLARDSPHASSASPHFIQAFNQQALDPLLQKLNTNADSLDQVVKEIENLRSMMNDYQEDVMAVRSYIEEDRTMDRYERLEEHLNDFVELTQNELTNLKHEISNMEEKIDYQLEERTRDLQEALENANTRITKMELQNQHQQLISMEGVDSANAKVLLTKFINVLLAFLAVLLVFASSVSNIVGPILNSRWKAVTVAVLIFAFIATSGFWRGGGKSQTLPPEYQTT